MPWQSARGIVWIVPPTPRNCLALLGGCQRSHWRGDGFGLELAGALAGRCPGQPGIETCGLRLERWHWVKEYGGQALPHVTQAFRCSFRQIEDPVKAKIRTSVCNRHYHGFSVFHVHHSDRSFREESTNSRPLICGSQMVCRSPFSALAVALRTRKPFLCTEFLASSPLPCTLRPLRSRKHWGYPEQARYDY